jgi:hypothetical protein
MKLNILLILVVTGGVATAQTGATLFEPAPMEPNLIVQTTVTLPPTPVKLNKSKSKVANCSSEAATLSLCLVAACTQGNRVLLLCK